MPLVALLIILNLNYIFISATFYSDLKSEYHLKYIMCNINTYIIFKFCFTA